MRERLVWASETSPAGGGTRAYRVVLRYQPGGLHPWVVHYQGMDARGGYWEGGYRKDHYSAAEEYLKRCKHWGLHPREPLEPLDPCPAY